MKQKSIYIVFLLLFGILFAACHDDKNPPAVTPDPEPGENPEEPLEPENGCALWNEFVAARKNGTESTLPDFSYAGYDFGERSVPDVAYPLYNVMD